MEKKDAVAKKVNQEISNIDVLSPDVLKVIKLVKESAPEMENKSDEEILELLSMLCGCSAWENK